MGCGDIGVKLGKELVGYGVERGLEKMGVPPLVAKAGGFLVNFLLK